VDDVIKFITIVTIILGVIFGGNALNSKTELERVFITHEQRLKIYYYNLFLLSGIIAFFVSLIYITWKTNLSDNKILETSDWSFSIVLGIFIFICCLISLGTIIRLINNIFIKHHYKYMINLKDIGEVYILSMMNPEVCICSKDPNTDLEMGDKASYLIKLDTVMQNPLTKKKILKPQRNLFQKLID